MVETVGYRRVDRVFCDIAQDAVIVVAIASFRIETTTENLFHPVRQLPGARNDLTQTAHSLRVGRDDRNRAQVMQQALRPYCAGTHPVHCSLNIFRQPVVQPVHRHNHVELLGDRVDAVRQRRVGR